MSDIDFRDTTNPEELAEELETLSGEYARRTGDYSGAGIMDDAAKWLRYLNDLRVGS